GSSSMACGAVHRQTPEAGARCVNRARRDLCGGYPVTGIPTATRKLSEEDLLSEFGLTSEMINTLKEIPLANLDKLTDCTQLLLKPNEAVLWEALKALPQK
ncbi:hypothetical protein AB2S17_07490, partial [Escherichia coli]